MKYISSAGDKNEELIKSIMKLRLEKSKILGFNNFAELSLSSKMADNVDEILSLLDDLKKVALPKAIDEFNEIKEYALKNGGSIEPWDMSFWAERLKENKFSMSEEELKNMHCHIPNMLSNCSSKRRKNNSRDIRAYGSA